MKPGDSLHKTHLISPLSVTLVQWDPPRKTELILFPLCLSPLYSETLPGRQYTENKERYRLFLTPLFSNSSLSHGRLVQPVVIYFISFFSFFCLVSFKNTCSSYAHTFLALVYLYPPWPRKCSILQFIKTCFYTSFHHNQVVAHSNSRWISCNS